MQQLGGEASYPKVHAGFLMSYQSARLELLRVVATNHVPGASIVTGHSLGGALATLSVHLTLQKIYCLQVSWLPGRYPGRLHFWLASCRKPSLRDRLRCSRPHTYRVANENDGVSKIPTNSPVFEYKHVATYIKRNCETGEVEIAPSREEPLMKGLQRAVFEHVRYFSAKFPENPLRCASVGSATASVARTPATAATGGAASATTDTTL